MRTKNKFRMGKGGETSVSNLVISGLIFAFLSISVVTLLGIASANNVDFMSNNEIQQLNSSFSGIYTLSDTVDNTTNSFLDSQGNTLTDLYLSGWTILRAIPNTFVVLTEVISSLGAFLGVPAYLIGILVSIFMAVVLFNILSAVFQRRI